MLFTTSCARGGCSRWGAESKRSWTCRRPDSNPPSHVYNCISRQHPLFTPSIWPQRAAQSPALLSLLAIISCGKRRRDSTNQAFRTLCMYQGLEAEQVAAVLLARWAVPINAKLSCCALRLSDSMLCPKCMQDWARPVAASARAPRWPLKAAAWLQASAGTAAALAALRIEAGLLPVAQPTCAVKSWQASGPGLALNSKR